MSNFSTTTNKTANPWQTNVWWQRAKYDLSRFSCMKFKIDVGYNVHAIHVCKGKNKDCAQNMPQNSDPAWVGLLFLLKYFDFSTFIFPSDIKGISFVSPSVRENKQPGVPNQAFVCFCFY